ncbi:MAG: hypothetical protein KatS3mg031_1456 [Chitinophagales bacterium]|nr:MAG: hypothetical protein KatS3mg031_1456 [Chitinophagales bacterium]
MTDMKTCTLLNLMFITLLGGAVLMESCAAPTPAILHEEKTQPVISQDDKTACLPKWGPDSVETIKQISLYSEFFKQGNYKDAVIHWRYVFRNAPGARLSTFVDGAKMYKEFIDQEKDPAVKEKLIDTLILIYDKRMECMGVSGEVLGRQAIELLNYRPQEVALIYEKFEKAIQMDKEKTKSFLLYPYALAIANMEKAGKLTKDKVVEAYSLIADIIDKNLKKGNKQIWQDVQRDVDAVLAGYLDCESMKPVLQRQYDASPNDEELLNKIYNQMRSARCITDPLFLKVTEQLFKRKPDSEMARILAITNSNAGNYAQAEVYYREAIKLEEDKEKKAEYYMALAEINYRKDDFVSARNYAQQAASLKPNWGKPYLLIGDLYRASGKKCGPGTGWESQVVTWPAIDMYEKAKAVDPSVATEATQRINDTRQYMPSQTECFFRNLKEGDPFKVECWINEMTTVRYGPEQ